MQAALPSPLLSQLSRLLAVQMGLHYPAERWRDLERGIGAAAPELGVDDARTCARLLSSAPLTCRQIEVLARHLTVGETYFFRGQKYFDALDAHILPTLLERSARDNRPLRIWSAGCCTGEEPYSIAMSLDKLMRGKEWKAVIVATDINPAFLEKAARGIYGEWSFRETPAWIRERYFKRRKNGEFEIVPHIRRRVAFSHLNLAGGSYPSPDGSFNAMDIIFCRNVLMYFNPEGIRRTARKLHRSLDRDGWLIVSPAEVSVSLFPQFEAISYEGSIFYRKTERAPARADAPPHVPPPSHAADIPAPATPASGHAGCAGGVSRGPGDAPAEPSPHASSLPSRADAHAAVPASPAAAETHYQAARSCADAGNFPEAIEWCEKAISADKLNPAIHYFLANLKNETGNGAAAMESLQRTLYLDPDFVLAHFSMAALHLSHGRTREARRCFGNTWSLLQRLPADMPLPESEGMTAAGLIEIMRTLDPLDATPGNGKGIT